MQKSRSFQARLFEKMPRIERCGAFFVMGAYKARLRGRACGACDVGGFFLRKKNAPNKSGRFLELLLLLRLALQRSWQVRLDRRQYCLEALGVAGDDVAFLKEVMTAGEIAHQAASFLDQQGACSHVPLGQA